MTVILSINQLIIDDHTLHNLINHLRFDMRGYDMNERFDLSSVRFGQIRDIQKASTLHMNFLEL